MPKKRIWLTTKRLEKNLTQKELAKRVGVSNSAICDYESGFRTPNGKTALRIARELDFDMALFYEDSV